MEVVGEVPAQAVGGGGEQDNGDEGGERGGAGDERVVRHAVGGREGQQRRVVQRIGRRAAVGGPTADLVDEHRAARHPVAEPREAAGARERVVRQVELAQRAEVRERASVDEQDLVAIQRKRLETRRGGEDARVPRRYLVRPERQDPQVGVVNEHLNTEHADAAADAFEDRQFRHCAEKVRHVVRLAPKNVVVRQLHRFETSHCGKQPHVPILNVVFIETKFHERTKVLKRNSGQFP